jgi:hypothetical protein
VEAASVKAEERVEEERTDGADERDCSFDDHDQGVRSVAALARIIARGLEHQLGELGGNLLRCEWPIRGVDLFRAVCEVDAEGVVGKLRSGVYDPDATTWVKVLNREYTQRERHELFERRAVGGRR